MEKVTISQKIRPCYGEVSSGDIIIIDEIVGSIFMGVVDIAGHGKTAARLAEEVRESIATKLAKPLDEIVKELHQELKSTIGGVIGLARFHKESNKLDCVIIGNITIRIFGEENYSLLGRDGVLGFVMPTPCLVTTELKKGDVLIISSDGVSTMFNRSDYKNLLKDPVDEIAENIISDFAKKEDDASCIVLKVEDA